MFLASYHNGYEWQDGIEEAVRRTLNGRCRIESYYLDTKNNPGKAFALASAERARLYIESLKPDVVIASDDNVSRYVIRPHFKDATVPFVFCGVNWSAEEYGFPYSNVTGMVEIISIDPLLKVIAAVLPEAEKGVFIAGDVPSTRSNYERYRSIFSANDIRIDDGMVVSFAAWKKKVRESQSTYDFIVLANKAGIRDWNQEAAYAHLLENTTAFTVGHHEFMVELNMFSMTKIAREQGEWAAEVALEILNGANPADFPIVVNRRWNIYANEELLKRGGHALPPNILLKAVKVKP